ncbi:MAG: hypothetical protein EAZ95_12170 [Bacteroidetes bacterium]|nr:MAG: hypothetical protein EAZ95_12170 [Bacteroidota bacterium]
MSALLIGDFRFFLLFCCMKAVYLFIFLLILAGCGSGSESPCLQADGVIITQERATPIFHSIVNKSSAKVYITQTNNNEYGVKAIGSNNLLTNLTTTVRDGVLTISSPSCVSNNYQYDILIKMPNILSVTQESSGKIIGENYWYTNGLVVKNTSSGEIDIEVDATQITSILTGSGKIFLYGVTPILILEHKSSGTFKGFGLATRDVEAYMEGSGDGEVTVSDNLKVSLKGSGDLYFRGYPLLDVIDNGSGDVINDN